LQTGDEMPQALLFAFSRLPGTQQFPLVRAAVAGVEDGGADQNRLAVAAGLDCGGDQHRQAGTVRGPQVKGDTADLALHLQQRREMGLVVELPADGEQVAVDQLRHRPQRATLRAV
jgi:hypothetical protein